MLAMTKQQQQLQYGGNQPLQPHGKIRDHHMIKLMVEDSQERISEDSLYIPSRIAECLKLRAFTHCSSLFHFSLFYLFIYLFIAHSELK